MIEYDGIAHFLPTRFGGISQEKAQENLITAQRRDRIKNNHCDANDVPMLRIQYWDFDNIETMVMNFIAVNWVSGRKYKEEKNWVPSGVILFSLVWIFLYLEITY